jgi:hypothetical protein
VPFFVLVDGEKSRVSWRAILLIQVELGDGFGGLSCSPGVGSSRPGHWDGREESRLAGLGKAREASAKSKAKSANEAYADLFPVVSEMKAKGLSLRDMAVRLNADGHTTRHGKPWNPVQVARVLERA